MRYQGNLKLIGLVIAALFAAQPGTAAAQETSEPTVQSGAPSPAIPVDTEELEDVRPVREARERGFVEAKPGDPGPPLPFPGLTRSEADKARGELAAQDLRDFAAAQAATDATRLLEAGSDPIDPDLEHGRSPEPYEVRESADQPLLPHLAPAEEATQGRSSARSSGCSGNCYQTDRVDLANPTADLYAGEYWVWLAIPQTNETNRCDSTTASSGCFWFASTQYQMDRIGSGMHIGPQRGSSMTGSTGSSWRMNIDGYIDGVHIGGQSSVNLPVATWMRVRTWRLSYGNAPFAPYTAWSTWGVWAYYNGQDHYLGSLTLDGHLINDSLGFMEVYEANGQCSTDLERTYFNDWRFWNTGYSQHSYTQGNADYEDNCLTTSWEHPSGGMSDFLRDERETSRSIAPGALLWIVV